MPAKVQGITGKGGMPIAFAPKCVIQASWQMPSKSEYYGEGHLRQGGNRSRVQDAFTGTVPKKDRFEEVWYYGDGISCGRIHPETWEVPMEGIYADPVLKVTTKIMVHHRFHRLQAALERGRGACKLESVHWFRHNSGVRGRKMNEEEGTIMVTPKVTGFRDGVLRGPGQWENVQDNWIQRINKSLRGRRPAAGVQEPGTA